MKIKFFFLSCLVLFIFSNVSAQERFVKTVDEAKNDASVSRLSHKIDRNRQINATAKYILSIGESKNQQPFSAGNNGISLF